MQLTTIKWVAASEVIRKNTDTVTSWFTDRNDTPVHAGYYECVPPYWLRRMDMLDPPGQVSRSVLYWDGAAWFYNEQDTKRMFVQYWVWRGLAEPPSNTPA